MSYLTFKGLKLGSTTNNFTYLACDESNKKVFKDKSYFNKYTEQIWIYKCKLGNELCEIIDFEKEVLLIRVEYTIDYFGNERRYRVKDYIYLDNTLYLHNKDIKRVPKEIKLLLEEYFENNNILTKVNLNEK